MNPANPNLDPTIQDPSLDKGVLSSAQVPESPNHFSPFASVIPASVQLTTPMYILSKPKPIQDLFKLTGANTTGPDEPARRYMGALVLATEGYVVDPWCDAFPNDPVVTMLIRTNQNIAATQGLGNVGTLYTSLDPAKYPPFYPPGPSPATPNAEPLTIVGKFQGQIPAGVLAYLPNGGVIFGAGPLALKAVSIGQVVNGGQLAEGGITYTAHVSMGLFGETVSFSIP